MRYNYTDSELKALLQSMVILIDTREQQNSHIVGYFDKQGIPYKNMKLDIGDYSFMLPKNQELGIPRDIYFDRQLVIERKASLEELSGNLTQDRTRFESELLRAAGMRLFLLIENGGGWWSIAEHRYKTQYDSKSYLATLKAFESRYRLDVNFTMPLFSGEYIRLTCFYHLREYLKGGIY